MADDWKYSREFMKRFGSQLVKEIKRRTPVDTGSLRADVVFEVQERKDGLLLLITIDDHITPVNSDTLPSEYGLYLDQGNNYTRRSDPMVGQSTQGWLTAPIPGLTAEDFVSGLEAAMSRDVERQVDTELGKLKN